MLSSLFPGITVRLIYGLVSSFLITMVLTPGVTERLRQRKMGQSIREEGVKSHLSKGGIPTMGGLVMLVSIVVSTLVWQSWSIYTAVILCALCFLGAIGFVDDFLKISRRNSDGLSGMIKLSGQTLFALVLAYYLYQASWMRPAVFIPLVNKLVNLGWLYIPFVTVVVVGSSNAVNLTDGLDGLAAGILAFVFLAYSGVSYMAGNAIFARHVAIPYLPGTGELAVFCATVTGACIGFLWYNTNPATIFMGDTGSLAVGGALGTVAVLVKNEVLLVIIGGIFVIEALSVIIQVLSFKSTGRRVFRMSPIHHHFELEGWAEQKVVIRFWIITLILCLIGVSVLGLNSILAGQ